MKPPAIGEAISKGVAALKANPVPLIVGCLIGGFISIIPGVGTAGIMNLCLKAVRGQKPEIGDVFVGFQKFVDHLIMGILQAIGAILCCIGMWITMPLFMPGTIFILDKNMKWGEAKDKCMAEVKPNLFAWIIFVFVCMLVGGLGMIACGIGQLVTLPIAMCAIAYGVDQAQGGGGGAAAPAAKA